jgi:hypothetical protein
VKNRRSLTPVPVRPDSAGVHATRRGKARHELSARVLLNSLPRDGNGASLRSLEGWALNVSQGGVRVILEEKVELGAEFEVGIEESGTDGSSSHVGRIVWVQEEPDGVVAGIEFRTDE